MALVCDSLRKRATWIVGEQFEPGKDDHERTRQRFERMVIGPRPAAPIIQLIRHSERSSKRRSVKRLHVSVERIEE